MAESGLSNNAVAPVGDGDQLTQFDETVRLLKSGQFPEALIGFNAVHARRSKELGANHPHTLTARHYTGMVHMEQGDWARAEAVNREVLVARETLFGRGSRSTWGSQFNLLSSLSHQLGDLSTGSKMAVVKTGEVEAIARKLLTSLEDGMGKDAPPALGTRRQLITLLHKLGRDSEARQLLDEGLVLVQAMVGPAREGEIQAMKDVQAELGQETGGGHVDST